MFLSELFFQFPNVFSCAVGGSIQVKPQQTPWPVYSYSNFRADSFPLHCGAHEHESMAWFHKIRGEKNKELGLHAYYQTNHKNGADVIPKR